MKNNYFFIIVFILAMGTAFSQQTIGLFKNSVDSYNGYTLFGTQKSTDTYLINNCGEKVHSWTSQFFPRFSYYLLENSVLLRTGSISANKAVVEMIDWDNNLIWDYSIDSAYGTQHHDIAYLPNGNILFIVYDDVLKSDVEAAGSSTLKDAIKSEQIIEVQPDLINGGGTVVWRWRAWDHIIQDADSTKPNFGIVSNHPEKINVNYLAHTAFDWLHFNSIDYNYNLDQILVSVPNFDEFWIIDHSTTTAEAASSSEGNSGKGGDLLYRWGNPLTYAQGTVNDKKLFYQHNVHWIESGLDDEGKIMVFNNRAGIPDGRNYSTVNIIDPPLDSIGSYSYSGNAFGPTSFDWTYKAPIDTSFFSNIVSSAQRLPNGNTLVCQGEIGRFFEINSDSIVWEYVNPDQGSGPATQGDPIFGNKTFRCLRYPIDYPGFDSKILTSQGYIESGSNFTCELFTVGLSAIVESRYEISIYPNPTQDKVIVSRTSFLEELIDISMYDLNGKRVLSSSIKTGERTLTIDLFGISEGFYFLSFRDKNSTWKEPLIIKEY
ncbi:MAG: hypothetical protein ACI8V8_000801 [Chitinophagales bacterium]|jgi:hypothetical protein